MKKRSLIFGAIALALMALMTLGCENAAGGPAGAPGAVQLPAGTVDASTLQDLLNDYSMVIVSDDLTITADYPYVVIPAGKTLLIESNVTSVDLAEAGIFFIDASAGGNFVNKAATKLELKSAGIVLIAPDEGSPAEYNLPVVSKWQTQAGALSDAATPDLIRVDNLKATSADADATNINSADTNWSGKVLLAKTNKFTAEALTAASDATIIVVGDAEFAGDTDQTGALNWFVTGNFTVSKAPTTSGTITVLGNLSANQLGAASLTTGAVKVKKTLSSSGDLGVGGAVEAGELRITGDFNMAATATSLKVNGPASISEDLVVGGASILTFNGDTTVGEHFEPAAGTAQEIAGRGRVVLGKRPTVAPVTAALKISNTKGVVLNGWAFTTSDTGTIVLAPYGRLVVESGEVDLSGILKLKPGVYEGVGATDVGVATFGLNSGTVTVAGAADGLKIRGSGDNNYLVLGGKESVYTPAPSDAGDKVVSFAAGGITVPAGQSAGGGATFTLPATGVLTVRGDSRITLGNYNNDDQTYAGQLVLTSGAKLDVGKTSPVFSENNVRAVVLSSPLAITATAATPTTPASFALGGSGSDAAILGRCEFPSVSDAAQSLTVTASSEAAGTLTGAITFAGAKR